MQQQQVSPRGMVGVQRSNTPQSPHPLLSPGHGGMMVGPQMRPQMVQQQQQHQMGHPQMVLI